jgi:CheY-like chemotaxis protein
LLIADYWMTPRSHNQYTILVVDDDPSVLATYRRLLTRAGYQTLTESDPLAVLNGSFEFSCPDLLLLDYKMPGTDGLSLLAQLRSRGCRARCILLSAYLNDDVRSRARMLGVDLTLEKPIDACALRQAIGDLLPLSPRRAAAPMSRTGP